MSPIDSLHDRLGATWTYALVGGVASAPLTLGLYWSAGAGNEFSLNAVFLGGLLAGALAESTPADASSAGVRAGLIGSLGVLPGVAWSLSGALGASGREWFEAASVALALGAVAVAVVFAGVVGLFGGIVGGWLVEKWNRRRGRSPS